MTTLYITAFSFEDRCRAMIDDIASNERDQRVLAFDFLGYEDVGPYLGNRAAIIQTLKKSGIRFDKVRAEIQRPLAGARTVRMAVERHRPDRIVCDISSLPRNYLFCVCAALAETGIESVLRYYRPEKYGTALSRGVGAVHAIPGFEGDVAPTGEVVLAVILGFEGYKALTAWERIGPKKLVGFLGDPPYREDFLATAREHNSVLFDQVPDLEERRLHTSDVDVALQEIQAAYDGCKRVLPHLSFVLCPLGTKPQSLAAFAFSRRHRDVAVVYVSSLEYYTENYSRGWDPEYMEVALGPLLDAE